jgi:hypothetical protein
VAYGPAQKSEYGAASQRVESAHRKEGSKLETPLNASARNAGSLISANKFVIPQFQREYSWREEEILEFWNDLKGSLNDNYFIGLIILTEPGNETEGNDAKDRRYVVDGQQRLITLTLIVAALHRQAMLKSRTALADRLQADFLTSIDYRTDHLESRIVLSDNSDNETFQHIIRTGELPETLPDGEISRAIAASYSEIQRYLELDLKSDPFKRLGAWSEFLTSRLYMAVFVHPDASTAYQVYEVINTRGRDLTTADLLKNYILTLIATLDRATHIESLSVLVDSILTSAPVNTPIALSDTAVAIDANILLRLSTSPQGPNIADYLGTRHAAPFIMPGQIIQEFWNNQLGTVNSVAETISKHVETLKKAVKDIDSEGQILEDIQRIPDKIQEDYGYLYDGNLNAKTKALFSAMSQGAKLIYSRRTLFLRIAEERKANKTPPGFKDQGHGDFFVWVDFLTGLQAAKREGKTFSRVVFVTQDQKADWVRGGVAHPILTSEVRALFSVPFEIWKMDRLIQEVNEAPE